MTRNTSPVRRRVAILGYDVDNLTLAETLERVAGFIATGRPHQQASVNADKVVKGRTDARLRRFVNGCDLVNADGMPVVWASYVLGEPLKERVAGIDLFEALMARAAENGWRVYLLGAREEVVTKVRALYEARYPGIVFAGHRNGYWRPEEEAAVAEAIRDAHPDLLFVGMPSPRKEEFLDTWQARMQVPFAMGVGGSFDVAAGLVTRAPVWMQHSGLEWFHRFAQEPRRMFRRYFVEDMHFFVMLGREALRRRVRRVVAIAASLAIMMGACVQLEG